MANYNRRHYRLVKTDNTKKPTVQTEHHVDYYSGVPRKTPGIRYGVSDKQSLRSKCQESLFSLCFTATKALKIEMFSNLFIVQGPSCKTHVRANMRRMAWAWEGVIHGCIHAMRPPKISRPCQQRQEEPRSRQPPAAHAGISISPRTHRSLTRGPVCTRPRVREIAHRVGPTRCWPPPVK